MLQLTDENICETPTQTASSNQVGNCTFGESYGGLWPNQQYVTLWNSYPVYACTDKTKKAIEILKSLEADKVIELKSVKRFIEMVEKISNIL